MVTCACSALLCRVRYLVLVFCCVALDGGKVVVIERVMIDRRECVSRDEFRHLGPNLADRKSAIGPGSGSCIHTSPCQGCPFGSHQQPRRPPTRSPPRRPHLPFPGMIISATLSRDRDPAILWASRPPRFALSAKRLSRSSLPGSKGRADLAVLELHDGSRFLAHRPRMTPAFD